MRVEQVARVCHEANTALQVALGEEPSPHWDDAPAWVTDSALDGVHKALAGATAEQLHKSWCDFKHADGWHYGPVKDAVAKTHPCLVAYQDLPREQQLKDTVFYAIVSALA